jgi:hypothetical protein
MLEQKAARRAFFLSRVKRGPAAGSDYRALMNAERGPLPMELSSILSGLSYVIVGGVATRMYQPERFTKDVDVLVEATGLPVLRERLHGAGGTRTGPLALPDSLLGLEGEVWLLPDVGEIDALWSAQSWVHKAVRSAVRDAQGLSIVGLPHLIAMKLDASRSVDQGDLSRMLGFADATTLDAVRLVVAELLPNVRQDLESYIEIGRLEIGDHGSPDPHRP